MHFDLLLHICLNEYQLKMSKSWIKQFNEATDSGSKHKKNKKKIPIMWWNWKFTNRKYYFFKTKSKTCHFQEFVWKKTNINATQTTLFSSTFIVKWWTCAYSHWNCRKDISVIVRDILFHPFSHTSKINDF